jgi:hypothetical protein
MVTVGQIGLMRTLRILASVKFINLSRIRGWG